ncbi:MAG: hypothetical protein GX237_05275 [Clostridiales bacterium]|nr:hypothetical protein [Clostridiales bacterium]
MKAIYKNEIKRAFTSLGMKLALLFGCGIAIWHVISVIVPIHKLLISTPQIYIEDPLYIPEGIFNNWMGNVLFPLQSYIFYLVLPLLAVLPFGASFFDDRKSGYYVNVCIREKKEVYYRGKYFAVFLSGGLAIIIPLVINLMLTSLLLPAIYPDNACNTTITCRTMAYELFYKQPWLYVLMFLFINFVFAGVIATLALSYTYYTEHKFGVMVAPFLIYFFLYSLMNLLDLTEYSPFYLLNGGTGNSNIISYFAIFFMFFCLSYLIYMWKGKRNDVL